MKNNKHNFLNATHTHSSRISFSLMDFWCFRELLFFPSSFFSNPHGQAERALVSICNPRPFLPSFGRVLCFCQRQRRMHIRFEGESFIRVLYMYVCIYICFEKTVQTYTQTHTRLWCAAWTNTLYTSVLILSATAARDLIRSETKQSFLFKFSRFTKT